MAAPRTTLSLDDLERYAVTVRGKPYRLHSMDSLPVLASKRVSDLSLRLQALIALDEPTKKQEQETEGLLDALCREILVAPDAVQESLTGMQRLAVYQVFLRLPSESLQVIAQHQMQTPVAAKTSTGASKPPASRASTAVPRTRGSRKSPRGLFARVSNS